MKRKPDRLEAEEYFNTHGDLSKANVCVLKGTDFRKRKPRYDKKGLPIRRKRGVIR